MKPIAKLHKESRPFFDKLSNYGILKECPAPWSSLVTRVIQKFPDWPPGARTASDAALCH
jgi:hypothetical protein